MPALPYAPMWPHSAAPPRAPTTDAQCPHAARAAPPSTPTRGPPTPGTQHPGAGRCRTRDAPSQAPDAGRAAPPRGPLTPVARRPLAVPRRRTAAPRRRPPTRSTPALLHARPGGRAGTDPRGGRRRPAGGPRYGGALGFRGGRGAEWSEEIDSWSSTKG